MHSVAELEDRLSEPSARLMADLAALDGDILVLGAGGKLGPSLVRLALRAVQGSKSVIAVSRFGDSVVADRLAAAGARLVSADIADDDALSALPDASNVIFLVGSKFGSTGREADTWYTNAYLPGRVAQRYKSSRIVALSTGNVYPFTSVSSGGPDEDATPGPVGEYAMSCLGRERVMTRFAQHNGTPLAIMRLNYAVEMRYGVLIDIARSVLSRSPVDVTMSAVNVVWQGYANEAILRSLRHAMPDPFVLNVAGPETLSVRQLALDFGNIFGLAPIIVGSEAPTALLSNSEKCLRLFGYPDVPVGQLVEWTASWVRDGLPLLGKPTGFQNREGKF